MELVWPIKIFRISTIQYEYDAGGGLLKEIRQLQDQSTLTIEYLGELQYENNTLVSIFHEAGKTDAVTDKYQYYLTDHVGSTRAVIQEDPLQYTSTATFEETSMTMESQQFIGYEETTRLADPCLTIRIPETAAMPCDSLADREKIWA